jgi:hypothetical protein
MHQNLPQREAPSSKSLEVAVAHNLECAVSIHLTCQRPKPQRVAPVTKSTSRVIKNNLRLPGLS